MSARRRRRPTRAPAQVDTNAGSTDSLDTSSHGTQPPPLHSRLQASQRSFEALSSEALRPETLERAHLRLQKLYEISKVLTRFGKLDTTVNEIFSIVRQAFSMRSAIFILQRDRSLRTIIWRDPEAPDYWLESAKAHARTSYAYLSGGDGWEYTELADDADPAGAPDIQPALDTRRVLPLLLPLAVQRRPIFGALQIESPNGFDEADLFFFNAIVNQLSIAIDRQAAIDTRQTAADNQRLAAQDQQATAEAKQARAEREEDRAVRERLLAERQRTFVEAERAAAERKRAAADELRERYEALVDNIDHAFVWEADADTARIRYVSARAEKILGYPRQRWLEDANLWMDCVHPSDRQALIRTFRRAQTEGVDQRCDHRCITAAGRVLWLHTGVHAVRDSKPPWLQGVSLDISLTKEAEARLRDQLEFTRAVTHSIGDGVLAVDMDGRLNLFNAAAAQMLGWTDKEALGRPFTDIVQMFAADGSPIAARDSPLTVAMRQGQSTSTEDYSFAGKGGERFPVSLAAGPLWRGGRFSGAVLAFQNTTERTRIQRALHDAVERAQRATHDREDLLAIVSHDLKNPLSVILMISASLPAAIEAADQQRALAQVESVRRSAERMNRQIKDLLDMASLQAGKLSVELRSCSAAALVGDALEAIRPLATSKSIRLESELAPDLPRVWADLSRVDQVLSNLLGNALKFTPEGGRVRIRVQQVDESLEFAVSDTGPGVPAHDLPHLFDRFYQVRRTARLGSGLGLSIVKGVVEAHGGHVWVQSQLGAGSTFFFTLRLA